MAGPPASPSPFPVEVLGVFGPMIFRRVPRGGEGVGRIKPPASAAAVGRRGDPLHTQTADATGYLLANGATGAAARGSIPLFKSNWFAKLTV